MFSSKLPPAERYRDGTSVGFSGATGGVMRALSFEVEYRVPAQEFETENFGRFAAFSWSIDEGLLTKDHQENEDSANLQWQVTQPDYRV